MTGKVIVSLLLVFCIPITATVAALGYMPPSVAQYVSGGLVSVQVVSSSTVVSVTSSSTSYFTSSGQIQSYVYVNAQASTSYAVSSSTSLISTTTSSESTTTSSTTEETSSTTTSASTSTSSTTTTSTTETTSSTSSTTTSTTTSYNPSITLNPSYVGYGGQYVTIAGSGFSPSDTSCIVSGTPVGPYECSIASGIVTGRFYAPPIEGRTYTIRVTGSPTGDFASAPLTIGGAPGSWIPNFGKALPPFQLVAELPQKLTSGSQKGMWYWTPDNKHSVVIAEPVGLGLVIATIVGVYLFQARKQPWSAGSVN